jgi:hypothetical protein
VTRHRTVDTDRTARERLIDDLIRERWAPLLPPPKPRPRRADVALMPKRHPGARPTGTGWPEVTR